MWVPLHQRQAGQTGTTGKGEGFPTGFKAGSTGTSVKSWQARERDPVSCRRKVEVEFQESCPWPHRQVILVPGKDPEDGGRSWCQEGQCLWAQRTRAHERVNGAYHPRLAVRSGPRECMKHHAHKPEAWRPCSFHTEGHSEAELAWMFIPVLPQQV